MPEVTFVPVLFQFGRALFRSMAASTDGSPVVGPQDLGVRPVDLQPDNNGLAHPMRGGMSVAPDDPMNLPIFRRPASLAGTGKKPVWEIADNSLGTQLTFRQDTATHGVIEPTQPMPFDEYTSSISATAPKWLLRYE